MDKTKQLILKDLNENLGTKLAQSLTDFEMLCEAAGIPKREYCSELLTTLMQLTAGGIAANTKFSPTEAGEIFARIMARYQEEFHGHRRRP